MQNRTFLHSRMQMLLVFLGNYYKKNKNKNAGRVALLAVGLKMWIASAFFFFFFGGGGVEDKRQN